MRRRAIACVCALLAGATTASAHHSLALFETDKPEAPAPAWGREEAWIWLGQLFEEQKKWDDAKQAYQKALEIQPNNAWVKATLLPELDKRKAARK